MTDVVRALKVATETGDVRFGLKEARKFAKKAKMVVVASNCPPESIAKLGGVRIHRYAGTNAELGAACGVPFSVTAVTILNPGESGILSA